MSTFNIGFIPFKPAKKREIRGMNESKQGKHRNPKREVHEPNYCHDVFSISQGKILKTTGNLQVLHRKFNASINLNNAVPDNASNSIN